MTQTVREKMIADCTASGHALSARRLFILFSGLARINYKYSATKLVGSEGNTLLARPKDEIVTVDCASLADAFVELVNECVDGENASRQMLHNGMDGFATQAASRCFDTTVTGNIRKPGEAWGDTARCIFKEHYFVETGAQTRQLYDPCMFTAYSSKAEVMAWKFRAGGGKFNKIIKFVEGDASALLVYVPPTDPSQKPHGFNNGMILFKASDLKKDEFSALSGHRLNPNWSETKFESIADTALASINKMLKNRAGINTAWEFPT